MSKFWLQTRSGIAFDLEEPTPDMVVFDPDVFWSLSKQDRYNGHASDFISIAEHSIRVAVIADVMFGKQFRRAALGHDFDESITGDVPSPIIRMLNRTKIPTPAGDVGVWDHFIAKIRVAFADKMKLPELLELPPEVKRADALALMIEKKACHVDSPRPDGWPVLPEAEIRTAEVAWRGWCASRVKREFGWVPWVARVRLRSEAKTEGWI